MKKVLLVLLFSVFVFNDAFAGDDNYVVSTSSTAAARYGDATSSFLVLKADEQEAWVCTVGKGGDVDWHYQDLTALKEAKKKKN